MIRSKTNSPAARRTGRLSILTSLRQPRKKQLGGSRNKMRSHAVQETKVDSIPWAATVTTVSAYPALPEVTSV